MTIGSKVRPVLPQEERWSTSLPLQRQWWPGQGHVFTIWSAAGTAAGRMHHSWHTSVSMAMPALIVCKHESLTLLFVFYFFIFLISKGLAWHRNYTLYSQYNTNLNERTWQLDSNLSVLVALMRFDYKMPVCTVILDTSIRVSITHCFSGSHTYARNGRQVHMFALLSYFWRPSEVSRQTLAALRSKCLHNSKEASSMAHKDQKETEEKVQLAAGHTFSLSSSHQTAINQNKSWRRGGWCFWFYQ